MKLRQILDIIYPPKYSLHHIDQIEILVQEYCHLYIKLVGPLKPKHFLLHYARMMRLFGPTYGYWTMRTESKQTEVKGITNILAGSKNFLKSVAIDKKIGYK